MIMNNYSKEELQSLFDNSISYAEVLRKMGHENTQKGGRNVEQLQKLVQKYNIDTSHLLGKGHNKNKFNLDSFRRGNAIRSEKRIAVLSYLRGAKCEQCGNSEWNGQKIPLCTHHIDGDHLNNELENLQLLCPNCHAQTDNYCGRNKKYTSRNISDEELITALKSTYSIRQALMSFGINYAAKSWYDRCYKLMDKYDFVQPKRPTKNNSNNAKTVKTIQKHKAEHPCPVCNKMTTNQHYCSYKCAAIGQQKTSRPDREELKEQIRTMSFLAIGKQYDVTDNTIRKWCKQYNLPYKKKEIKKYSDKEWVLI